MIRPVSVRGLAGMALAILAVGSGPAPAQAPAGRALFVPLDTSAPIPYAIGVAGGPTGRIDGDTELCEWALADWSRASAGRLRFVPAREEPALVEIYFVPAQFGQYGEMRPLVVDGRRGAAVYIRPDMDGLGPEISSATHDDPLLRETIVYLTCLHELGHALGLAHTDRFADIMYFFGFGGDIRSYFGRYRERLNDRADIARTSGLSDGDIETLRALYAPGPRVRAEIDQLLMFIRESDCRFVRNGREYGAERAYRHVLRKFRYFEEQIGSAEDFIDLAASRSTVSGRPYRFVCNGEDRESAAVLHEALRRLRAGAAK